MAYLPSPAAKEVKFLVSWDLSGGGGSGDKSLSSILGRGAIGLGIVTYTDLGNDALREGSALSQVVVSSWKLQPG